MANPMLYSFHKTWQFDIFPNKFGCEITLLVIENNNIAKTV